MCQCLRFLGFALLSIILASPIHTSAKGSDVGLDALDSDSSRGIIKLDVVVNDSAGNSVLGLKSEDFTLFDNEQRQKIVSIEPSQYEVDSPDALVETVFLIDALNLSPAEAATAKSEVAKFLRERGGHLRNPVMVYRLSSFGLTAIQRQSTDGNVLADELIKDRESKTIWAMPVHPEGAPRPDADQARNEASLKALGAIAIEERKKASRKLLIWVGPGWPTEQGGHYSFEEIIELSTRLREARLSLFSVTAWEYPKREFTYEEYLKGVRSENDARTGDVALEVLATKSGGLVTMPAFDLQGTIDRCVEHANDFYIVSFDPPKTDHPDEYHAIRITVNGRDASARTNSEYYNQPSYYDQSTSVQRMTVEQFENDLSAHRVQSDAELARYLSTIELTERLDHDGLTRVTSLIRGKKSGDALTSIVDRSAFLPPPQAETPHLRVPDATEQTTIIHRLGQYVRETIPNLPNFYATRTTVRYSEPGQKDKLEWKTVPVDQSLHPFGIERLTVLVRNSKEVTDSASASKQSSSRERNLFSEGAFGPIFSMISSDIFGPSGKVEWARWEGTTVRPLAVFSFAVGGASPVFEVGFCCLLEPDGTLPYKRKSGYHGEIAVDPQSGAMQRIWIEADVPERLPIVRTAFSVDFGQIAIGEKTYLCPTKSVYISRGRTVKMLQEWAQTFAVYGPFQTLMNDVTFSNYHVFRSNHRILADVTLAP